MRIGLTCFTTDRTIGPVELARAGVARALPDPAKLDDYASLGITEVALRLPSGSAEAVLRALDAATPLLTRFAE